MNLTVNVVNTPNYGVELKDNPYLLNQLSVLTNEGITVAILVNGSADLNFELKGADKKFLKIVPHREYRAFLGHARNILASKVETEWYIQMDEDDCFQSPGAVIELAEVLKYATNPLVLFREQSIDNNGTIVRELPEDLVVGSKARFYHEFLTDHTIAYNTQATRDLLRPAINNAVDQFYAYILSQYFDQVSFYPHIIYNYAIDNAKMTWENKGSIYEQGFDYLDNYLNFTISEIL